MILLHVTPSGVTRRHLPSDRTDLPHFTRQLYSHAWPLGWRWLRDWTPMWPLPLLVDPGPVHVALLAERADVHTVALALGEHGEGCQFSKRLVRGWHGIVPHPVWVRAVTCQSRFKRQEIDPASQWEEQ